MCERERKNCPGKCSISALYPQSPPTPSASEADTGKNGEEEEEEEEPLHGSQHFIIVMCVCVPPLSLSPDPLGSCARADIAGAIKANWFDKYINFLLTHTRKEKRRKVYEVYFLHLHFFPSQFLFFVL